MYHLLRMHLLLLPLLLSSGAQAIDPNNPPEGRFSDDWAEIYLAGKKIGYAHSSMTREGDLITSATHTFMQIGRVEEPIRLSITEKAVETVSGKPRSFENTQDLSIQKTTTRGEIRDGKVHITTAQYGNERTDVYDWPEGALLKTWGSYRESLLRGFAPGTKYDVQLYEPAFRLDGPLTATTSIGGHEEFEHAGKKHRGQRVTMTLASPMGAMELLSWVDGAGKPLKATMPAPGLGDMEIVTTDQATALADFLPPELFTTTTVKARRSIDRHAANRIRYRIRTTKPGLELGELPETAMQSVGARSDAGIEITVTRLAHETPTGETPTHPAVAGEFLEPNLMINTADPELIALAKKAGGEASSPYALGDQLRRFVGDYIADKNLTVGFATASEVARTREGDCSEHGVLLAALGRLNGLPSRVAVGLAYVPVFGRQDDIFGYHMWTQFWIDGRWVDFDAALNESNASPARITFATSSLKNAGIADLSLPLLNKIGAIDIDILDIEPPTADTTPKSD